MYFSTGKFDSTIQREGFLPLSSQLKNHYNTDSNICQEKKTINGHKSALRERGS